MLYISAAGDLRAEREILGRAVAEIPVTLGWRTVLTPERDEPADLQAAARADVHLLLIGTDIRAPIGQEWLAARRGGKRPYLFMKEKISRTSAADDFIRYLSNQAAWQPFNDRDDLRWQVDKLLGEFILEKAVYFALRPEEYERLQAWRKELDEHKPAPLEEQRGGAGQGAVILSPERYVPSEGVLIEGKKKKRKY